MKKHHPDNVRVKRRYLDYLKQAHGHSEASLDAVAKALARFETYTKQRDFKAFRPEQAKGFKAKLAGEVNARTGSPLSKATLNSTAGALRAFFKWLAGQPGYRSKLSYSDADYFNLSAKDARVATARRDKAAPTLEQIGHVLTSMPCGSDIELRDRALIAFTILTGARDGALASFRLKHVDLERSWLFHDARDVKTKASKTFDTWFFPVGEQPLEIVSHWIAHLRGVLLWGDHDPLFPRTKVVPNRDRGFEAVGLERECWSNAQRIRGIFQEAFTRAGLPYFNPHSFRNTLALLGERMCRTPEEFKVWSQNLGHENVLTTLTSYGTVAPGRQAEVMRELASPRDDASGMEEAITRALRKVLKKKDRK